MAIRAEDRAFEVIDLLDGAATAAVPISLHLPRYHRPRHAPGRTATELTVAALMHDRKCVPVSPHYALAKRAIDLMVSACLLLCSAPLFAVIALCIKLDSRGPVFFVQERIGHMGRPFGMIKFRSMLQGSVVDLGGTTHKRVGDRRVTRVGAFLRRTSLDELPQLINVLRGDMSLVGPRPEIALLVHERYERWQYQRFFVPQGISGWWQVTGRGTKPLHEHTADDLHYIEHASFWFDVKIIGMTVRAVVKREGAF